MRVFQIKGFSGFLMFFLAMLGVVSVFILLPTAFVMVFWNALVFETMRGPEINLGQAALLWAALLLTLYLVLKPQFSLQFKRVSDPADIERHLREMKKKDQPEE